MAQETFRSVSALFLHRVKSTPERSAFTWPAGAGWKTQTWRQAGEVVRELASGLKALGLQPGERVAILAGTRVEWILADLAVLCAGGATTTIYPSSKEDECAFILGDSQSRYVFAENPQQLAKLRLKKADIPGVEKVILMDGHADDPWVMTWTDLVGEGHAWHEKQPDRYEADIRAVAPDALCTLIYTSGTTGRPKGVELTHDAWVFEAECLEGLNYFGVEDVNYLWLPLAHSFGKVLQVMQLQLGFLSAIDGRVEKLVENLAIIQPTLVPAVPRIFEKVYNRVVQQTKDAGGVKWKIFQWAFDVGLRVARMKQDGGVPSGALALQYQVADRLVFSKIRARFGGRVRAFVSGSAPLNPQIALWFYAAGLIICEGYGLTESSAASFVNRPESVRFGTVGPPLKGVELKLAADGEILIKGRGIMRGYHNLPLETAEALDGEGWLHTGDIGEVDSAGRLKITDRKKELIKTSGGKYVAPGALESTFKALCPYVSQLVVHGDARNFVSALVAFDEESLKKWTQENGVTGTYEQLSRDPKVVALFQGYITQLNAQLPGFSAVKKFALLPADLTEASGDLTPSMKLKRKAVEKKYKDVLDGFYVGALADAD